MPLSQDTLPRKAKSNINISLQTIDPEQKFAFSVDCVLFGYDEEEDLKVLLLACNMSPYDGLWGLLGDLLEPYEDLDEAPARILKDRAGLADVYYEQVQTFGRPDRHPLGRVISTAFYSLIETSSIDIHPSLHNQVQWRSVKSIGDLAFDHNNILDVSLERLKRRLRESPIGFNLLPQKFTLAQLQNLYETVLDLELDKRNFRRKMMSLGVLEDLDELQQMVHHRPAKLYRFDKERYHELRKSGLKFVL